MAQRSLKRYREKRSFDKTPEPSGSGARKGRSRSGPRYVIQKHAARNLHYDFRLELDGVLLSWSVPKGPSLAPEEKRLAVRTEDHPLDYADFEGVIPKGEYGGGAVIVWDRGTWEPEGDARKGLERGRLTFDLHGEKLRGRWHLVRTKLDGGKRENWLLFKSRDAEADAERDVVAEEPQSAASGRTIEAVADAPKRVWHSDRKAKAKAGQRAQSDPLALVSELPLPFPLTNLEKVLYPEIGLRKGDILAYYAVVADRMLPDLAGRVLTLVRCPDGRDRHCFFQKHATDGVPKIVQRVPIEEAGKKEPYMAVRDLAGLLALPQLGALEIHAWVAHADKVERPDQLVFDVDPDVGLAWDRVVEATADLRATLRDDGIESFVKTTGGKGLHVVAPVERRRTWDEHKEYSRQVAERLAERSPDRYTTSIRKRDRTGRIFLDYLRNGRGATAVVAYSTRAREGATVATPLTWEELEAGVDPHDFTVESVPRRIARQERDPWEGYAGLRQGLPGARKRPAAARPASSPAKPKPAPRPGPRTDRPRPRARPKAARRPR
jgi:bifunctional non-homologous end joining protein LigD